MNTPHGAGTSRRHGPPPPTRRVLDEREATGASRTYWESAARAYQAEHGAALGGDRFLWGPEGLDEAMAGLLGPVADLRGRRVLEVGGGAGQCSRWLRRQGVDAVAVDISVEQLRLARELDLRTGTSVPVAAADALHLPVADASVDAAFSAYGAPQFVADAGALLTEVARVVVPGGRWVFSVTHPVRWCFPDDPGPDGLVAQDSYFDRRPYVEHDAGGRPTYAEHHRTLGDRVRDLRSAGFELLDLVEPEWPSGLTATWGQWSPLRGAILPGTAIFVSRRT